MKKTVAWLLALASCFAGAALAQSWPARPIKLEVPFAAGGNTDAVARIAADRLTTLLGQPVLVENRAGASGAIAAEYVMRSAPDGYTLFVGATPNILVVPQLNKVNYDWERDFVPVAIITTNPFVLGIHPTIGAKTLREFVDYAKARPGKLNYGSGGTGTIAHLSAALLVSRAGLVATHVPYKGGGPAVADLVGGQLDFYFGNAAELIPHMRSGKVTVLAVSSEKRARELPDVPSVAETYPGFQTYTWNALFAPAGTPRAIVERIAHEVGRAVKDPATVDRIQRIGSDPSGIALEEFTALIRREKPIWIEAVKAAGLKQE